MTRTQPVRPIPEQSLAELLGPLPTPSDTSGVTASVARLWTMPLKRMTLGDLRLLIAQKRGLEYLVPRALAHVRDHPLAEGTYYEGDLLSALASLPDTWWQAHASLIPDFRTALARALPRLASANVSDDLEATIQSALSRTAAYTGTA
jgi:hypothetical protein